MLFCYPSSVGHNCNREITKQNWAIGFARLVLRELIPK